MNILYVCDTLVALLIPKHIKVAFISLKMNTEQIPDHLI